MRKLIQHKTTNHKLDKEPDQDSPKAKFNLRDLAKTLDLDENFEVVYTDAEDALRNAGVYYITGEINTDSLLSIHQDVLAKHLSTQWRNRDIQLIVNSIGGEVSEGWMFIDLLDFVRMDIRTVGIGEICSLGTMLVAAGTPGKRVCAHNTSLMVHGFSMSMRGSRQRLIDTMGFVEREHEREIEFWVRCSKLKRQDVEKLFLDGRDHYFTPQEALKLGIIDAVESPKYKR